MPFIQIPFEVLITDLTHAERTILLWLSNRHFKYCQRDYTKEFFVTDRDLASFASCSTETVYRAKRKLTAMGILTYRVGPKNRTHYTLTANFWRAK